MINLYVNMGSTAGGTGLTNEITGADRAFATLYAAVDAVPDSPADAYTITCTKGAGGEDTTPLVQTPFTQTTTAAYYILIQAAAGDKACIPHNTGRYTLAVTNADGIYNNTPCHLRIDGLQVRVTVTDASSKLGIKTSNANQTAADIDCRITNCVVKAVRTSGSVTGFNSRPWDGAAGGTSVIKNCATYNGYQGFNSDLAACEMYNCTSFDCDYGFVADAAFTAVNCLGSSVASYGQFIGAFSAGSNYNAEDDSGGVPGANSHSGHVFTFVNAGADNFHLAAGDVGARGLGIGPGSDAKVPSTDIDGDSRSGATCDIGADEYVAVPEGTVVYEAFIGGPQACPIWVSPSLVLTNAWDATLLKVSGTDRTIAWSIRKLSAGISEAFAESQSITTTQHSLPRDATYDYASTQAGDGLYQIFLDVNALVGLDLFRFRIYEEAVV